MMISLFIYIFFFRSGLFHYYKLKGIKSLLSKWHTEAINADTDSYLNLLMEGELLVTVILNENSYLFN